MAIVEIPMRTDVYWYAEAITLGDEVFRFSFTVNTRDNDRWYMDIYTSEGDQILTGIPLVVDYPLLFAHADSRLPDGELYFINTTGSGTEAEIDDPGDKCRLIFIPTGEA